MVRLAFYVGKVLQCQIRRVRGYIHKAENSHPVQKKSASSNVVLLEHGVAQGFGVACACSRQPRLTAGSSTRLASIHISRIRPRPPQPSLQRAFNLFNALIWSHPPTALIHTFVFVSSVSVLTLSTRMLSDRNASTFVDENFHAGTRFSNSRFSSAYERFLDSGRRNTHQTTQMRVMPAQKSPVVCQFPRHMENRVSGITYRPWLPNSRLQGSAAAVTAHCSAVSRGCTSRGRAPPSSGAVWSTRSPRRWRSTPARRYSCT